MSDAEGLLAGQARLDGGRPAAARWLPGLLLGAAFLAMALATWGAWPDVMVDFGSELYIPWRLTEGAVLGREILFGGSGPFSHYLNALLFQLFGVGLRTVVIANLVLLAGTTWLLFSILRDLFGDVTATTAGLFFLLVFGFGQYTSYGNYNFVTPYTHGVTHGLVLSLAVLWLQRRFALTRRWADLAASALCLGAALLTKPEIFVAAAAAAAVQLGFLLRAERRGAGRVRLALVATAPALVPPLISFAALSAAGGTAAAWEGTFSPWLIMATPFMGGAYYAKVLGLDQPAANAGVILASTAAWAAFLGAAALLDVRAGSKDRGWHQPAVVAMVVVGLGGIWILVDERSLARGAPGALPVALLAGGLLALVTAWRQGAAGGGRSGLQAGFTVFAGLLLLKLGLLPRFYHYGFVMAAPAALLAVAWMSASVPGFLRSRGGRGAIFRAASTAAVLVLAGLFVSVSMFHLGRKEAMVGTGSDRFLADRRGEAVQGMVAKLSADLAPGETLAVIPEGVMLNYLVRRRSPTPHLWYLPNALAWKGEGTLLAALRDHPPDYIVIASRDSSEYGPATFGVDYALETWRWIQAEYQPIGGMGPSPFQPGPFFGLRLLRHRSGAAAP